MTKIRILQEDCDPELGDDKSLPYTCYLITYKDKEGNTKYDLAVGNKQVDIFDHYWDKYKEGLLDIQQAQGTINPKLWKSEEELKKEASKKK